VPALADEVQVDLAEGGQEAVRIVARDDALPAYATSTE